MHRVTAVRPGANALGALGVTLLLALSRASIGPLQGGVDDGDAPAAIAPLPPPAASPTPPTPSPFYDTTPRMIIPVTG